MQYYSTTLPRIPVSIDRKIKVLLLLDGEKKARREENFILQERGAFQLGDSISAIYSDEDNEPAWYPAKIYQAHDEDSSRYWVTFDKYGNQACVDFGDMALPGAAEARAKQYNDSTSSNAKANASMNRKRGRDSKENEGDDLMQRVLDSARAAAGSVGKNYSKRVGSVKSAMTLKMDKTANVYQLGKEKREGDRRDRDRDRERDRDRDRDKEAPVGGDGEKDREENAPSMEKKKKSSAMTEEQKKLMAQYGDAANVKE
jgi:hypothetical protein